MITLITAVSQSLQKVFDDYKAHGMEAVYLWGSVTTEDFDPETSDVDSIAIVSGDFDVKLESVIRDHLQSLHPDLLKFGFRLLYVEELRSGSPIKSQLAKWISPRLLLLDLPNWHYVAGKKYTQADLTDKPVTYREAMKLRLEQLRERGWEDGANVEPRDESIYLKNVWRMVHLMQLMRGINTAFSYSSVKANTDADEREIVQALDAMKRSRYDRTLFVAYIPLLNDFVESIKKTAL